MTTTATGLGLPEWREHHQLAAQLRKADPWRSVDPEAWVLKVESASLGLSGAVVGLASNAGRQPGMWLFSGWESYAGFVAAMRSAGGESPTPVPDHLQLGFHEAESLPAHWIKEVKKQGWLLASKRDVPAMAEVRQGKAHTGVPLQGVRQLTVLAAALTAWFRAEPKVVAGWAAGEGRRRAVEVTVFGAAYSVAFEAVAALPSRDAA